MKTASTLALLFAFLVSAMAADTDPPVIVNVSPSAGSTVSNLTQITVTFSEAVVNVQATDLIMNEQPAVSRSG